MVSCKPDLLVPANPVILDGVPDLTNLTYLNEPSILHGLNLRYAEDEIYTHAGPVLIAINPFKQVRSADASLCLENLYISVFHYLTILALQASRMCLLGGTE